MKNEGIVPVSAQLVENWKPAFEKFLGAEVYASLPSKRKQLLSGMAATQYAKLNGGQVGLEADMSIMTSDNTTLAANVQNPVSTGTGINGVQTQKGSGDRQFLVGICVAIAAKTIGLDLVQTIPATSANVTIKYLNVIYNGGNLDNAANNSIKVVTIGFDKQPALTVGQKYVIGHATPDAGDPATAYEFIELTYVKPDRKGDKFSIFTVGPAFTATNNAGTLSDINYVANGPAIGQVAADGVLYSINAEMTTITQVQDAAHANCAIENIANTNAVENYVPYQTTKGLHRTLTRSEADAGTEHQVELDLHSDSHVIGNRVFIGNCSRLQFKRLQESGVDAIPYLTAAMKNEVSQEINYQIVSAARSYGLTNALAYLNQGSCFNTYIGPKTVATKAFNTVPYADELFDKDGQPVADKFPAMTNLLTTMEFETIKSIGDYLCMLITQAAYSIGTDSRFGEADSVVVGTNVAGYLAACSKFSSLRDKDVDLSAATGAKLSGYIGSIKVYVDVNAPLDCPYVTVLRSNQDVSIDVPGVEMDNIMVPGLAYLVKDLISTVTLVPSGTGGQKIILDSETDLIEVSDLAYKAYVTFCFLMEIPGMHV